jgi:F420H(2)-dependent quinone reductase
MTAATDRTTATTGRPQVPTSDEPARAVLTVPEPTMPELSTSSASLPPHWFIRSFWVLQRALYRVSGGRLGLRRATATQWGMMRLQTTGRRSGIERAAILGYVEDGADLVTMAMNGWADPDPAWWLNLQANPDATVEARHAHAARARGPR